MKVGTGCSRELGIAERFVAGSLAGAIAQSAIYPLEVCDAPVMYVMMRQ